MREPARTDVGADPAPLTLGDSVMLLAVEGLADEGYRVIAQGCRGFDWGLRTLRVAGSRDRLPHLVVLALGSDHYAPHDEPNGVDVGRVRMRDIRAALKILGGDGGGRILTLVTPMVLGGGASPDAKVMRRAARMFPDQVEILDWVRYSAGREDWFQPDGIHLTYEGAAAYVELFRTILPQAVRRLNRSPSSSTLSYRQSRWTISTASRSSITTSAPETGARSTAPTSSSRT